MARCYILAASSVFPGSLVLLTVDLLACTATGNGTLFLWHVLNAAMVGLSLFALIGKYPPRRGSVCGNENRGQKKGSRLIKLDFSPLPANSCSEAAKDDPHSNRD